MTTIDTVTVSKALKTEIFDDYGLFTAPLTKQIVTYKDRDFAFDYKSLKKRLTDNATTLRQVVNTQLAEVSKIFQEIRSTYCVEENPAQANTSSLSLFATISSKSPTLFTDTSQVARYKNTLEKVLEIAKSLYSTETTTLPFTHKFSTRDTQDGISQIITQMSYGPRETGRNISVADAEATIERLSEYLAQQSSAADQVALEVFKLFIEEHINEKSAQTLNAQASYIKRVIELTQQGVDETTAKRQAHQELNDSAIDSKQAQDLKRTQFIQQISDEQILLKLIIEFKQTKNPQKFVEIIDRISSQNVFCVIAKSIYEQYPDALPEMFKAYESKGWTKTDLTNVLFAEDASGAEEASGSDFPPAPTAPAEEDDTASAGKRASVASSWGSEFGAETDFEEEDATE